MKRLIELSLFTVTVVFFVQAQVPTITSFTPTSGSIGTVVTITGTNFNTTATNNIVYFGAVKAVVNSATSTSLSVTVPTGATYQPITVTVNGLTAYSNALFTVTFPSTQKIDASSFGARVSFATGTYPKGIAIADFDGDGKPDLVSANGSYGTNGIKIDTISIFRNTSINGSITAGSFAARIDLAAGIAAWDVAVGDIDGDGKPDIAVTNEYTTANTVSVYRNTSTSGNISFAPKQDIAAGTGPAAVKIFDVDSDGKPDLLVTSTGSTGWVSIYRSTSSIGNISFTARLDFPTGVNPQSIAFSDIDSDGKSDMIVSCGGYTNNVGVFRNTSTSGNISFNTRVDLSPGSGPFMMVVADIDGDTKPDIIALNSYSNTISVFRNMSTSGSITSGSFASKVDFNTGVYPYGIAASDLDGDGKPDIVVVNATSNTISVFRNTSTSGSITSGSFATKIDYATGNYPAEIAIGDLDGDGKPDIVVTDNTSHTVSVFRNTIASVSPTSLSIKDVPYDQGGRVSMVWSASALDTNVNFLPSYSIWRSSPERLLSHSSFKSIQEQSKSLITNIRTMAVNGIIYSWECIGTQPAHRFSTYSFTAATLYDSMSTTNGKHYFMVSALTNDPNVFYDSKIDSGYSVDNLPPLAPQNLVGNIQSGKIVLHWEANSESDLRGYAIYRSSNKVSEPDTLKAYAFTTDTSFIDSNPMIDLVAYYYVKAQDIHENLSKISNQISLKTTNIVENNIDIPTEYSLNQNYPNPFNPSTTIQYGLPAQSSVRLVIYNVLGQVVKELINAEQQAGIQSVVWNANVASGIYFYRLEATSKDDPSKRFVETKKMLLLR